MEHKISKHVEWVGCLDWGMRDFHSFTTPRGVTYNSYLVRDKKTALIDTVKAPFAPELLRKISCFQSPETIDYIVVNHAEPDHSSSLPLIVDVCKKAEVVCTKKCQQILSAYYDTSHWKFHLVKHKDQLSLGDISLTFFETPMVHWPESMFTYMVEEKILFSMDAFGQHFTSSQRLDEEVDLCEVMEEAKRYYANIVMPYGKQVLHVWEEIKNLKIEIIAPSHGIVWKKHLKQIVCAYKEWASFQPKSKILVVYDSMWESTKKMAEEIVRGATCSEVETKLIFLRSTNLSDIITDVLDAKALVLGSATLNLNVMPSMGAFLTYLKGLKPENKIGACFGSYGWSKGAPEVLDEFFQMMKFEVVCPPIRSQWKPSKTILEECYRLGNVLAEKVKICGSFQEDRR